MSYQASFKRWHPICSRISLDVLLLLHQPSLAANSCIPPHLVVTILALVAAIKRWIRWFRVELLEWIVRALFCLWHLHIDVLPYLNRRRLNKTILQLLHRDIRVFDDSRLKIVVELLRDIWWQHEILLVIGIETTRWAALSFRWRIAPVYETLSHVDIWAVHRCKRNDVVWSSPAAYIDDLSYFAIAIAQSRIRWLFSDRWWQAT